MLYSVVIGIDRYADARIPELRSAKADATAISALLHDGIRPTERSVRTLLDEEATRSGIMTAIGEVLPRQQRPDDVVLLYFAGHGSPEQGAPPDTVSRYLIPHDADVDRVFATGISLDSEVPTLLERHVASRVFFIVDSCFSGRAGGRTFLAPSWQAGRAFRGPATVPSLRELDLGVGRVVLAACGDQEVAQEHPEHGVFTRALLHAWGTGRGPTVGVGQLYDDVFARVMHETSGTQHPVLKGQLEGLRLPRLRARPARRPSPARGRRATR